MCPEIVVSCPYVCREWCPVAVNCLFSSVARPGKLEDDIPLRWLWWLPLPDVTNYTSFPQTHAEWQSKNSDGRADSKFISSLILLVFILCTCMSIYRDLCWYFLSPSRSHLPSSYRTELRPSASLCTVFAPQPPTWKTLEACIHHDTEKNSLNWMFWVKVLLEGSLRFSIANANITHSLCQLPLTMRDFSWHFRWRIGWMGFIMLSRRFLSKMAVWLIGTRCEMNHDKNLLS